MGEIDLSSGFGVRIDPFLGRPAMHTGLDFRSSMGDPVRATANGTVETAGWNGGYGNMVEIDHGNGFATRYGHLSKIEVKVGQKVQIGQVDRPRRLDRPLDRSASALRDAHRRRGGRSAEIPARRPAARQRALSDSNSRHKKIGRPCGPPEFLSRSGITLAQSVTRINSAYSDCSASC